MPHDKSRVRGNNLNDPDASPADVADHLQRTTQNRDDEARTGGRQDDQGHTPQVPQTPITPDTD
jgi:hypothetical protein